MSKVKFQIDYRTQWGQKLFVTGSGKELGDWQEQKAFELTPASGERWQGELDIPAGQNLEYKYLLKDENSGSISVEHGDPRKFSPNQDFEQVFLRDYWRPIGDPLNNLYTAPFYKAFFKRDKEEHISAFNKNKSYIRFQLRAPRLGADYSFGIVGSIKALGSWDESKALIMSSEDYPVWKIDLEVPGDETPFEYKYLIRDNRTGQIATWEERSNRYFPLASLRKSHLVVWTDEYFQYPVGNWKAAGVALPVFSLRSDSGTGIGEFTDLIALVDWSVRTGMKLVQILPVNDTVATHSWIDSYPYAAISVHALHPIYANLQSIGSLSDKKLQDEIDMARNKLNQLEEIDYEAVMNLKSRFFKASFDENKDRILLSRDFKQFFKANEHWLKPYAVFSALRDTFKTPDFLQWKDYADFQEEKIDKFIKSNKEDVEVHYYIQYHLDKQLKKATSYARESGVVLKGDIPIGIYRNSVDAWVNPELFNMDCQAGAPPDDFALAGQNWGFPTYNWEVMAEDGYTWWIDRLKKMSEYFDVFRIDHILGFFRIWEIPWEHVEGIMGRFNPAIPVHRDEFSNWGIFFDQDRFCRPYLREHVIRQIFQSHADTIFDSYLDSVGPGDYQFKEPFDSQRKVKIHFDQVVKNDPEHAEFHNWIRFSLYRLHAEVLFMEAPLSDGNAFNPRISLHSTFSYQDLDGYTKSKIDELYNHFFYHRHNDFWADSAMSKLPALKDATDMLICGEDLGMVPACVPGVMDRLNILSLAIQRMPNDDREFWHPSDTPYLSVTSTGSHDMSTLREWWQEDSDQTQRFFNQILGQGGGAPFFCEPWIAKDVLNQHMHSPSMWAIFPLQDLLAMDGGLRRQVPEEERINVPANPQHYWRYRSHISMEELLNQDDFNGLVRQLVDQGGRKADY